MKRLRCRDKRYKRIRRRQNAIKNLRSEIMYLLYYSRKE